MEDIIKQVAALAALRKEATPGPWEIVVKGNSIQSQAIPGVCSGISMKTGNGAFIAAVEGLDFQSIADQLSKAGAVPAASEGALHYARLYSGVGAGLVRAHDLLRSATDQLGRFVAGEGDRYATDVLRDAIAKTLATPATLPSFYKEGDAAARLQGGQAIIDLVSDVLTEYSNQVGSRHEYVDQVTEGLVVGELSQAILDKIKECEQAIIHGSPAPVLSLVEEAGPAGWVLVPKKPSEEHLASLAMRNRHDYGLQKPEIQANMRRGAAQMYEEATGQGFFKIDYSAIAGSVIGLAKIDTDYVPTWDYPHATAPTPNHASVEISNALRLTVEQDELAYKLIISALGKEEERTNYWMEQHRSVSIRLHELQQQLAAPTTPSKEADQKGEEVGRG